MDGGDKTGYNACLNHLWEYAVPSAGNLKGIKAWCIQRDLQYGDWFPWYVENSLVTFW
jgi:hypothetical protein